MAPGPSPAERAADKRDREDLDRSFVHGVAWTGALKWASQIVSWASTLLVVRLLTPEDYGIMGMATLYLGLIQLLSEFGVGAAVLTLRDLDRRQVAQLNSLAVLFGIVGFAASGAAAIPLGEFFNAPRLPPVVVVVGFGFVVTSFKVVPHALLSKDLEFKLLSLLAVVQALATSVLTVLMAFAGLGYWALALGNLAASALYVVMIVRSRPHPFLWPRVASIRAAMTFSGHIIVGRLAWYTYSNADFLVIGRVLGQSALGVYTVAWSMATMVVDKISAVVGQVTPAFFSATQTEPAALRRYLLTITEILALVTFPASVGLALVAHDFTLVLLGEKWLHAVTPLRLLACYGIIRSLTPFLPQVLNVVGESAFTMKIGVAAAVVLPVGFVIGARWGIVGVALAWVAAYPLVMIPLYWRLFVRIDMKPRAYLRAMWPAASATMLMSGAVVLAGSVVPAGDGPPVLRFLSEVMAGAVAYSAAVLLFHRDRVRSFRAMVARARGRGPTTPDTAPA